jgi:hypothetical protein
MTRFGAAKTRVTVVFVGFDYSHDALTEIDGFFRRQHIAIVPLTVRDILDEQITRKLV